MSANHDKFVRAVDAIYGVVLASMMIACAVALLAACVSLAKHAKENPTKIQVIP